MNSRRPSTSLILLGLLFLITVACGPVRRTARKATVNYSDAVSLADSIWVFSQMHPDGFTLNIYTWEEPEEGISVAYSATQDSHDRADLDLVVSHAQAHGGFVGGWFDSEDGSFYFDSVRLFPEDSLAQAWDFARENGQLAFYILSSGTEVRLEEDSNIFLFPVPVTE